MRATLGWVVAVLALCSGLARFGLGSGADISRPDLMSQVLVDGFAPGASIAEVEKRLGPPAYKKSSDHYYWADGLEVVQSGDCVQMRGHNLRVPEGALSMGADWGEVTRLLGRPTRDEDGDMVYASPDGATELRVEQFATCAYSGWSASGFNATMRIPRASLDPATGDQAFSPRAQAAGVELPVEADHATRVANNLAWSPRSSIGR